MKLFGFEITRRQKALQSVPSINNWWNSAWSTGWQIISEPFTGAWQRNVQAQPAQNLLANAAVYACVSGISSDIAKNRVKLDRNKGGIWEEVTGDAGDTSPFLKVLRKPNHYQTRVKFIEQWIVSKLLYGNTYVLKQREASRGLVNALYVLHPNCVKPLVADSGDVFYEVSRDPLSQQPKTVVTVPASEIIHDMMVSLWHPLVGVSPIYACGMSATMGSSITQNSANLFTNRMAPGGVLTAPGRISDETAARMKANFEANFSGQNYGRLLVAGDGLKYEQLAMTSVDAQLIQQLRWSVEDIARAFHYPMFKLGGPMPAYAQGPHTLVQMYYTDCLQPLIEQLEVCLDEGLELPKDLGTEVDIDNLLRMDPVALAESNNKGVGGGWMKPNEARFRANLPPVVGGDTPYLQEQNFSLAALAERDADSPFEAALESEPEESQVEPMEPMEPMEAEKHLEPELADIWAKAELRKELASA